MGQAAPQGRIDRTATLGVGPGRSETAFALGTVTHAALNEQRLAAENRQVEASGAVPGSEGAGPGPRRPRPRLSQLNRSLEHRADKRPTLADLGESGALEQDSDIVAFICRDDTYHPDSPDKGTAEIIIAKHRNGPGAKIRLVFLERLTKFADAVDAQERRER